ncbi:TonB-dependent receptor [Hymenobacter sp. YC55]|uniref:SusC/RagA family TonB-linked outer membrane protein n=1 Tax=Hymenobacter sp. YC55 TaxID=3034019 RepID=UPI0023F9E55D|nr:TonB-dependent receptor [Hymenobacter sp. YC55]MDF7815009.1 TonB-dependent receptor [Hymenobacter sp. YC55]
MKNRVPIRKVRHLTRVSLTPLALCASVGAAFGSSDESNYTVPNRDVAAITANSKVVDITVTGTVTDTKGEGLPGVNVVVKGTTNGTQTDAQGNFSITVPDQGAVLAFSFIGYKPQEVAANSAAKLSVKLLSDDQALEEVVVVGYGTQSRATVTGAISSTNSAAITRTPAGSTSEALVGRIPGVSARQADARPGGSASIQIRNLGDPLYVIDGVVSDAGQFNNLGINDIENISILKDASAAIYGLRAANGVVLVTTKRGEKGKPVINVSGYYGLQNFTRFPHPANAYQHVRALAEAGQNQGRTPVNEPVKGENITPDVLEKWRTGAPGYESFDYYKFVFRPDVPRYYVNGSISGGSDNVRFYVSGSHFGQEAIIKDFKFSRTNLQANVEANITQRLKIGTQISGRIEDRFTLGVPGGDDYFNPLLSVFSMWPTERPYANDNPNYINQTHNVNVNPATYTEAITGYYTDYYRAAKGNFTAEYNFDFGLSAKAIGSYNYTNRLANGFEYTYNAYRYNPVTDVYETSPAFGNQNPYRERRTRNIIDRYGQLQLNYNKTFGDHGVSAVAAYERYDTDDREYGLNTVPPNNTIPLLLFANARNLDDRISERARAGYIGRVNYNYKQKYLLEVLGRYDGSWLFREDSRYGFFPGASVGWRISEEPFIKESIGNVLSELKLRGSYGRTGADDLDNPDNQDYLVAPYSYIGGYQFPARSSIFNGSYVIGVDPRNPPITTLSWITNQSSNIGVDFGFLEGKITGQFDVFERRRKGLLAPRYDVLLPSEVGYPLPQENLNSDAVRGMEGLVTYSGKAGELGYSVGLHATLARNRDLSQYKPRFGNSWEEYRNAISDRWAYINWGYQVVGVFQSQEEIENYPINNDGQGNRNQLPGDHKYKDVNGDGAINYLDERPIGYAEGATPYLTYAVNSTFDYKGFTLKFDLVGAGLQTYRREVEQKIPFQNNGTSPDYIFEDRWHREDPFNNDSPWISGKYPAIRRDDGGHPNYNRRSDFWITNVRYLRVRNLELGYNIPKPFLDRFGIGSMRVYVNGTNLYSFDNMKEFDLDPEIVNNGGLVYPQQRLYNAGFSIGF